MPTDEPTAAEDAELRAIMELQKAQKDGDNEKADEMADLLGLVAKQKAAIARRKGK